MRNLESARSELRKRIENAFTSQQELNRLEDPEAGETSDRMRYASLLRQMMELDRKAVDNCLEELIMFPPNGRLARHIDRLKGEFWKSKSFDRSIFIMSKFPGPDLEPKDRELERVLDSIKNAITDRDYQWRMARFPDNYSDEIWEDVEVHLLGCSRGIVVVEGRYLDELNPNIMMEWGFMMALGRDILFLMENEFRHSRADLEGRRHQKFSWENPEDDVAAAIQAWLSR